MASLHQTTDSRMATIYFVWLRGKFYSSKNVSGPCVLQGSVSEGTGFFYGKSAVEAAGAFALIKARCEIPSVNPDSEMRLFDQVLKEMDNAKP